MEYKTDWLNLKNYQVWMEGFAVTGQQAQAHLVGKIGAESFDEACIKLLGDSLDKDDKKSDGYRRLSNNEMCVWACGLYNNESDARKGFG